MPVADALTSSITGVVHMGKKEDSAHNFKDTEEEIIKALPKESREMFVARGKLVPVTNADGTIKHRIPSGFNRLFGANRQR
jgi:hypothetical protein